MPRNNYSFLTHTISETGRLIEGFPVSIFCRNFVGMKSKQTTALNRVRITAVRQTVYRELMEQYENPIEHACDVCIGQAFESVNAQRPPELCPSAWEAMRPFVESLARGEGNFYDGWMQNPMSAMISCNDGFRPVSFYIEVSK